MTLSTLLLLMAAAVAAPAASGAWTPADSARDEMRVGRHWHAAQLLRRAGAHSSDDAALRLLLAQAEAGWRNWPEVAAVLGGGGGLAGLSAEGRLLLGRALEESGRWGDAAVAFRGFLDGAAPGDPRRAAVTVRVARATLAAGGLRDAVTALAGLPPTAEVLRSWAALEGAELRAPVGDTAAVTALLSLVRDDAARERGWRVLPRARLAARDSAGAYRAYLAATQGGSASRRGEASADAGRLALARGDSAAARPLLLAGLEEGTVASRGRAAAALLAFRDTDPALTLRMAGALVRASDPAAALRAYDRAARLAAAGSPLAEGARLERARLMATTPSRHQEALEEFRAIRAATSDVRIGARNLELWAGLRRRQGRTAEEATLRDWLLAEYPSSPEAAEVRWARARARDGDGDLDGALRVYAELVAAAPEHARAGEARMRTGQILMGRGRLQESARVFEGYLADFPSGRRWEEASYWGARLRHQSGDTAAARRLAVRLLRDEPFGYYAVMATELLGERYGIDVPPGPPPTTPAWLTEGLARLDALEETGLAVGAGSEETRLVERARGDPGALLTLAEGLLQRGRPVTAINLGWELRREGAPWNQRLVRLVFPFPFREMVEREAREWGLDPLLVASVIRQESAFKADIVSHAGAVGLMQVMPATGRELAARHGPAAFREEHLKAGEISLHLGSAFLRDLFRRYDQDLTLALSAYNAGPARANRWRRYPEAGDGPLLTERIPFEETRGYVKNIRRNLSVYGALYGTR